jgi:hypothetical protein
MNMKGATVVAENEMIILFMESKFGFKVLISGTCED